MTISVATASPPAPDWYADPGGLHEFRYWDGAGWTNGVADGGVVTEESLPAVPHHREFFGLPGRAAWFALLGLVGGLVLGVIFDVIGLLVDRHQQTVQLALAQIGLWTGFLGACWLASKRYGTGHIRRDLRLTFERKDVLRGFLAGLVSRILVIVIALVLYVINHKLTGGHSAINDQLRSKSVGLVVVASVIALAAPLIEELFFRGLLMQSLQTRWGPRVAVGAQAIAFGLCHLSPDLGWGNVAEMLAITSAGLVLGWLAMHYRRLGPGVWAHGWFNLGSTILLLAS
jgi:membrane protease YdiL (CAAX protease family)